MDEGTDQLEFIDSDVIQKTVRLSYDGRQMMIRIPREIASFYDLKRGDKVDLTIRIAASDERPNRKIPLEMVVVEDVEG
ncbi:MAG: hypothetical protein APR53_06285 [Methanoculleus sp. SDB]|nr:MAG: hypothetical protein APR53_06285 [Methanoculleus sp. SDB]